MGERAFDDVANAPKEVLAADGKTPLYRFRFEGVIYARSRKDAQRRLREANLYIDRARLTGRT